MIEFEVKIWCVDEALPGLWESADHLVRTPGVVKHAIIRRGASGDDYIDAWRKGTNHLVLTGLMVLGSRHSMDAEGSVEALMSDVSAVELNAAKDKLTPKQLASRAGRASYTAKDMQVLPVMTLHGHGDKKKIHMHRGSIEALRRVVTERDKEFSAYLTKQGFTFIDVQGILNNLRPWKTI